MTLMGRTYLLVALAVAPAFALLIFNHRVALQQQEADAEAQALRSAQLVSGELNEILEGVRSLLGAAAQSPVVQSFQEPACTEYLHRLERISPNSGAIAAFDETGLTRCGGTAGVNVADRAYFQSALASKGLVIGEYTVGRASGVPVLPLALRFQMPDGAAGVIVAGLRLDWLWEHHSPPKPSRRESRQRRTQLNLRYVRLSRTDALTPSCTVQKTSEKDAFRATSSRSV